MLFTGIILYAFLSFAVPILIIVLIVRVVVQKRDKNHGPVLQFRDVLLSALISAAGYAGLVGLYMLPFSLFGDKAEQANAVLATHLITAITLLLAGMALKQITGKLFMVLGLLLMIGAIGPAFQTLGSAGALLAVVIAFVALIVITVRVSRKGHQHG